MKVYTNEYGMILVISLALMTILTLLGIFIAGQSVTGLKIVTGLRDYEKAFNLSDGACQIGVGYLTTATPKSTSWDPTKRKKIGEEQLPSHMKRTTVHDVSGHTLGDFHPELSWVGYDAKPMPGWMLNWQGYSSYHRLHYLANGTSYLPGRLDPSTVDALVVKVER